MALDNEIVGNCSSSRLGRGEVQDGQLWLEAATRTIVLEINMRHTG